jgi:tetratricopeptide (TPR) repeat protein
MKLITKLSFALSLISVTAFSQDIKKGVEYMNKERFNDARKFFNEKLKADVKHAATYKFYLGEICYQNEKLDSAKIFFKDAIITDMNNPLGFAGMGKVTIVTDAVEGQKNFEHAIALTKKNADPINVIANYYIQTKDKSNADKAIELLQNAITSDAKNFTSHILLGDAYLVKNEGSYAMSYFNKASYLEPKNPITLLRKGGLYTNARNYDEAMKMYMEGVSLDSTFGPIYKNIGELYFKAKQYSKAISNYEKYLSLIDNNDDAQFRYASFLYLTQDYTKAIEVFQKLEAKKYNNILLYRLKGFCLYENKNYDESLKYLSKFIAEAEGEKILPIDYKYMALVYLKKEVDSSAIKYTEYACQKDTSMYELWKDVGEFYFLKGNYPLCVKYYNKKFEKLPAADADILTIGKAYYFNKQYKGADSVFTLLTIARPQANIGYLYRARSNSNLDKDYKLGLAKPHYEKVVELCEPDPVKNKEQLLESYRYLGSYYSIKKDKVNADKYWNAILKLSPNDKNALDGLKLK